MVDISEVRTFGGPAYNAAHQIFAELRTRLITCGRKQREISFLTGVNQATISMFMSRNTEKLGLADTLAIIAMLGGTFNVSIGDDAPEVDEYAPPAPTTSDWLILPDRSNQ